MRTAAVAGAVNDTIRLLFVPELVASYTNTFATPEADDTRLAVAVPPLTAFVTLFDPVASQVPSVDTNVTLVVGEGEETTMGTGTLIDAVAGSALGEVIWNAIEAPLTLSVMVRVKPTVEMVNVTDPAPVGVTVVVNVPVESVVPEAGESVTVPAPEATTDTV